MRQNKLIQWQINLPMDFPANWTDEQILFYLNNSSWCCDNLIEELQKYSKEHGCICDITKAQILIRGQRAKFSCVDDSCEIPLAEIEKSIYIFKREGD